MWGGNDVFCVEFEFLLILWGKMKFFDGCGCRVDFSGGGAGRVDLSRDFRNWEI